MAHGSQKWQCLIICDWCMLVSAAVKEAGGKQRQPYIESAQAPRVATRVAHVVGFENDGLHVWV